MDNEKYIANIEPFNDLYFMNCFFSSLFPVVLSYKKDILPLLINSVMVYSLNSKIDPLYLCLGDEQVEGILETLLKQL